MDFDLLDYHLKMKDENVFLYYKGPFDESILNRISDFIRQKSKGSQRSAKKLFAIFIELAQNISYYSEEFNKFGDDEIKHGIGTVVIREKENKFIFTAGNLIQKHKGNEILKRCNKINTLDSDGLRALRKEIRLLPIREDQKGASIGLIQVALKSEHPLKVELQDLKDETNAFMVISTYIDKNA